MKCPRCEYSFSSNRDVCPRCGLDVQKWAAKRGRARNMRRSTRSENHRAGRRPVVREVRRSLASEKRESLKQDVSDLLDGLKELSKGGKLKIRNASESAQTRSVVSNPNSYDAIKAEWDRLDEDVTADKPHLVGGEVAPLEIDFNDLVADMSPKKKDDVSSTSNERTKVLDDAISKNKPEEVSYHDLRAVKPIRDRLTSGTKRTVVPQGKSLDELTQVIERSSDAKKGKKSKKQQAEFDKLSAVFHTTNSDSSSQHPVVLPEKS